MNTKFYIMLKVQKDAKPAYVYMRDYQIYQTQDVKQAQPFVTHKEAEEFIDRYLKRYPHQFEAEIIKQK